ncbi:MAG: serine protease [Alphaproteobacteria bacterium]
MKLGEFPFYLLLVLLIVWLNQPDDTGNINVPRQPQSQAGDTPDIRTPSPRGPRYVVEDSGVQVNSVGTAFSIDEDGLWITARHVVGGCRGLGFAVPGLRNTLDAGRTTIHPHSDMALVQGPSSSAAFDLATRPAGRGTDAYHIGYPRGRPGDIRSKVIGHARMITRGRYRSDEPVVAYAEVERHPAFKGEIGGMSGGPIFNAAGQVIGVTVAGNPRKGRIIGTAPRSFARLFEEADQRPKAGRVSKPTLTPGTLKQTGDRLRQRFVVARLHCYVG